MDLKNQTIEFPNNEVKKLWPTIYQEIVGEVKEPIVDNPSISFEEKIRCILRKHLDMNLVKTDDGYRNFFKNTLRIAVEMHTEKMLYKIEAGHKRYRNTGVKEDNRKK